MVSMHYVMTLRHFCLRIATDVLRSCDTIGESKIVRVMKIVNAKIVVRCVVTTEIVHSSNSTPLMAGLAKPVMSS